MLDNQTTDLPAVVSGIRSICAVASTLFGNASVANNPSSTGVADASPTDAGVNLSLSRQTTVFGLLAILTALGMELF